MLEEQLPWIDGVGKCSLPSVYFLKLGTLFGWYGSTLTSVCAPMQDSGGCIYL